MYIGIHTSAKELENIIKNPSQYDINAIQYMPTAPMRWITKPIEQEKVETFVNNIAKTPIKKILLHGIYLTNLAREDKQLFHLGKMGLAMYLDFAERTTQIIKQKNLDIEILGICFHPGSQKELSYEGSIERISYGIQWVLDYIPGTQKLLIETTAGSGTTLGKNFQELEQIREKVKDKKRVGFVIDTEHTYASGYDWKNNFDNVVKDLSLTLGIENIKAFHLNDSMVDCGSNKDRHSNIGEGKLGDETIIKILNYNKFSNIPFILETPGLKTQEGTLKEIENLNKFIKK